jgi:hypothetical protein
MSERRRAEFLKELAPSISGVPERGEKTTIDWSTVLSEAIIQNWDEFISEAEGLVSQHNRKSLLSCLDIFMSNCEGHEKCIRRDLLRPLRDRLEFDGLGLEATLEKIKEAARTKDSPAFRTTEERKAELERLKRDFEREIRGAKNKEELHDIERRYETTVKSKGLDPGRDVSFNLRASIMADEMFPADAYRPRVGASKPLVPVEREGSPAQREIEDEWIYYPKALDEARFDTRDKIRRHDRNEIIRYPSPEIIKEVPDNFHFTYAEEMVLLGFFNILSRCSYNHHLMDRRHGYFPGSIGKTIYFFPIRKDRDLYQAIGLKERERGRVRDAHKVKEAFKEVLRYQHPVIFKQDSGERNEEGKTIFNVIISHEPLFRLLQYEQLTDEESYRVPPLNRTKKIKDSIVLLNPTFFPENMVNQGYRLESDFYDKVEGARIKLSAGTGTGRGKHGWRREPAFLTFGNYLAHQGGHYVSGSDGRLWYECEREVSRLLMKLGLNAGDLSVLDRTLKIYIEVEYLFGYAFLDTKGGLSKLKLKINVDKFPHLRLPSYRFSQRISA